MLFLKGFCIGAADVVPGVSGGTMAFILGIYEELIESIRMFGRPVFLHKLISLDFRAALRLVNFKFLALLGSGVFCAILSLSKLLAWLLKNHPVQIWSFFFGLVLASVFVVSRHIRKWNTFLLLALIAGTGCAYRLVGLVPVQTPETVWFLFLSGFLAIIAMILPGISGAFILVLLGKYHFVLNAVNVRDLFSLGVVASGAVIGIVSFAQILGWLFRHYHDPVVAVLTGFMLGSLRKVWPWRITLRTLQKADGEMIPIEQQNMLPDLFCDNAVNGELIWALGLVIAACILVVAIEKYGESAKQ